MSKKKRRQRNHNHQTGPASSPESNEDRAVALYQSAKEHLEANRYRRAPRDAAKSLKLIPDMPTPLLVYAQGAALSGDAQGSLEAFTKLIGMYEDKNNPDTFHLYSGRAVAYSKLERYEESGERQQRHDRPQPVNPPGMDIATVWRLDGTQAALHCRR